jgi:putative SOS response-associated peptidase YedK
VAEEAWLSKNISAAELQALLRPLPDGVLKEYAVTTRVNSPAHNDASLLEPAA